MSKFKKWLCTSLLTIVATAPVMAGSDDAVPANNGTGTNATNTAEPAASPSTLNPTSAISTGNVTALLGVLVMKGVLAPAEAKAIQGAAPDAEFQLLVEALTRKGLLSAADVSVAANPGRNLRLPRPPRVVFREPSRHPLRVPKPRVPRLRRCLRRRNLLLVRWLRRLLQSGSILSIRQKRMGWLQPSRWGR